MKIAFDIKRMRPGCVILQSALGCESRMAHRFSSETWLVSLTPDMKVYEITPEQLEILVLKVQEQANKEKRS